MAEEIHLSENRRKICLKYLDHQIEVSTKLHLLKMAEISRERRKLSAESVKHDNGGLRVKALDTWDGLELILKRQFEVFKVSMKGFREMIASVKLENFKPFFRNLFMKLAVEHHNFNAALPMYALKDKLLSLIDQANPSFIEGEMGAGKTTCLPLIILQHTSGEQKVLHAVSNASDAIQACAHLNSVLSFNDEILGIDIYPLSTENVESRMLFMTHRSLIYYLSKNELLSDFSHVIIDDAHQNDIYVLSLLNLLGVLAKRRPDLKVVVTGRCLENMNSKSSSKLRVKNFFYPVETHYIGQTYLDPHTYHKIVTNKVLDILNTRNEGNILLYVLSPGDCYAITQQLRKQTPVGVSFGSDTFHDFFHLGKLVRRAINRVRVVYIVCDSRCVTRLFPGVKFVIDVGLMEKYDFDKSLKRKILEYVPISQNHAINRSLAAGSIQGGLCYRMYSKANFAKMKKPGLRGGGNLETELLFLLLFNLRSKVPMYESVLDENTFGSNVMKHAESLGWVVDGNLVNDQFIPLLLYFDAHVSSFLIRYVDNPTVLLCAVLYFTLADILPMHLWGGLEAKKTLQNFHSVQGDVFNSIVLYYTWMNSDKNKFYYKNNITRDMMEFFHNRVLTVMRVFKLCGVDALYPSEVLAETDMNAFKEKYVHEFNHLAVKKVASHLSSYVLDEHTKCFLHPGSVYYYEKDDCKFLLPHALLSSGGRYLMLHVTHVPNDVDGLEDKISTRTPDGYVSKEIGPFGSCVLEEILTKYLNGNKLEAFQSIVGDHLSTIKIDKFKGVVCLIYPCGSEETAQIFSENLKEFLNEVKTALKGDFQVCRLPAPNNTHSPVEAVLGAGAIIHDIINPGEYLNVCIEVMSTSGFKSDAILHMIRDYGQVLKYESFRRGGDKECLQVTFQKTSVAKIVKETFHMEDITVTVGKPSSEEKDKDSQRFLSGGVQDVYKLPLSWQWATHCNFALLKFTSTSAIESAIKTLQGCLMILKTQSKCSVKQSKKDQLSLSIHEIQVGVTEEILILSLEYAGISSSSYLLFFPLSRFDLAMDKAFSAGQEELKKIISNLSTGNFTIQSELPKGKSKIFFATINFYSEKDKLAVESHLSARVIESLSKYPIKTSNRNELLLPKAKVAKDVILDNLEGLKKKYRSLRVSISTVTRRNDMLVLVDGEEEKSTLQAHLEIKKLINGFEVILSQEDKLLLDNPYAHRLLVQIGRESNTFVFVDKSKLNVKLLGSPENIALTNEKLNRVIESIKEKKVEEIDLASGYFKKGVIKQLIHLYGYNLQGLKCSGADYIHFDMKKKKIFLRGTPSAYEQVEEAIKRASEKIRDTGDGSSSAEACGVCFTDLNRDVYRLQICSHPFCSECIGETINYHIREKVVPIGCPYQDCDEAISLADIREVSQESDLSCLLVPARHLFIRTESICRECPGTDCFGIFKASQTQKNCFVCGLQMCLQCNLEDHPGLSCGLVQKLKNTDKALLDWIAKDPSKRKLCGQCAAPVEKISGCNHITCSRCSCHFCWECLRVFPTGNDVYAHQASCTRRIS